MHSTWPLRTEDRPFAGGETRWARPYLDRIRIERFGCIKDASFSLTPLHALVGPNDSGKSTVLRAIRWAAAHAPGPAEQVKLAEQYAPLTREGTRVSLASGDSEWSLVRDGGVREVLKDGSNRLEESVGAGRSRLLSRSPRLQSIVTGNALLRLDPDALRASSHADPSRTTRRPGG
ncbi:MAG: AAA family ATPase [Myxococcales bacterium]